MEEEKGEEANRRKALGMRIADCGMRNAELRGERREARGNRKKAVS
jgi:hypothetical protein